MTLRQAIQVTNLRKPAKILPELLIQSHLPYFELKNYKNILFWQKKSINPILHATQKWDNTAFENHLPCSHFSFTTFCPEEDHIFRS